MGKEKTKVTKNARSKILKRKKKIADFETRREKAVAFYDAQIEKNIELALWKDGKKNGEKLLDRKALTKYVPLSLVMLWVLRVLFNISK